MHNPGEGKEGRRYRKKQPIFFFKSCVYVCLCGCLYTAVYCMEVKPSGPGLTLTLFETKFSLIFFSVL